MTFGESFSADEDKAVILKSNSLPGSSKLHTQLSVSLGINSNFSMRPHGD